MTNSFGQYFLETNVLTKADEQLIARADTRPLDCRGRGGPNEHVGEVDEAAQKSIRSCGVNGRSQVPNRNSFGRSLVYNQMMINGMPSNVFSASTLEPSEPRPQHDAELRCLLVRRPYASLQAARDHSQQDAAFPLVDCAV
jgi:hypothetical protein